MSARLEERAEDESGALLPLPLPLHAQVERRRMNDDAVLGPPRRFLGLGDAVVSGGGARGGCSPFHGRAGGGGESRMPDGRRQRRPGPGPPARAGRGVHGRAPRA